MTDPLLPPLLHASIHGTEGPVAVLLHGFTQTGASWRPVIDAVAAAGTRCRAVLVDLPGHGGSSAVRTDLSGAAAAVRATVAAAVGDEPFVLVGYSMGGRVALRLAIDHPEHLAGLVLVGATAGIDDDAERRARRSADEDLAASIERDGVEAFLDRWLALPLFAGLRPTPDDLATRRANAPAGLASSLRLAGTATMDPPWWGELPGIAAPTLVVWGERDAKFAALGQRLADAIGPNADTAVVGQAGHAAHLEQPEPFAALLAARLRG